MRTVEIGADLVRRIEAEARAAYPDEACGFLFSAATGANGEPRVVSTVEAAANEFPGERRRRFVITPEELRAAEARGAGRGEVVSGFYHSHPDHPARPSAFDTEHAWPWYAYLVVSVDSAGACTVGAFELDAEGGQFHRRPLEVVSAHLQDVPVHRPIRTES